MNRLSKMFLFTFFRDFVVQIAEYDAKHGTIATIKAIRTMFTDEGEKQTPTWRNEITGELVGLPPGETRDCIGLLPAKMLVEWAAARKREIDLGNRLLDAERTIRDLRSVNENAPLYHKELVKLRVSLARIAQATDIEYVVCDKGGDWNILPSMPVELLEAKATAYDRGWNYLAGCVVSAIDNMHEELNALTNKNASLKKES